MQANLVPVPTSTGTEAEIDGEYDYTDNNYFTLLSADKAQQHYTNTYHIPLINSPTNSFNLLLHVAD